MQAYFTISPMIILLFYRWEQFEMNFFRSLKIKMFIYTIVYLAYLEHHTVMVMVMKCISKQKILFLPTFLRAHVSKIWMKMVSLTISTWILMEMVVTILWKQVLDLLVEQLLKHPTGSMASLIRLR